MIGGLIDKFWAYLLAAGAALAVVAVAWKRGANSTTRRVEAQSARANERMLDAAVASPKDKDHVVKDLRSGRF
jgi:hypothetical protein